MVGVLLQRHWDLGSHTPLPPERLYIHLGRTVCHTNICEIAS
jgi:hypothetical protein